jgi:hypothetical protein
MRKVIVVAVAAVALVLMGALSAGAGVVGTAAPLHVRKVVVGPVPPGTQFVETVACEGNQGEPIIFAGPGQPSASSVQFVFDSQGNPVGTGDTVTFTDPGSCTVTETQTGGAASVSYQCEGTLPLGPPGPDAASGGFRPQGTVNPATPATTAPPEVCETSGPQSDPITVNIISPGQEATVTVTNTFVAPPPPPAPVAVVVVPLFTG